MEPCLKTAITTFTWKTKPTRSDAIRLTEINKSCLKRASLCVSDWFCGLVETKTSPVQQKQRLQRLNSTSWQQPDFVDKDSLSRFAFHPLHCDHDVRHPPLRSSPNHPISQSPNQPISQSRPILTHRGTSWSKQKVVFSRRWVSSLWKQQGCISTDFYPPVCVFSV